MPYASPPPLTFTASRLDGKAVFVSGASSGIGAAAARLFAAEGALVAATARRIDRLQDVVAGIKAAGGQAIAVGCDVRDESSVADAVHTTVKAFGKLDAAFDNAGEGGGQVPLHQMHTAKFDSVLATNLRGVFLCLKHQIPHLIEAGGGSIVVTSSIGGLIGGPRNSDYAASKWGLAGLIRCAALDYAPHQIRVNAIAPGATRSEMFDRWMHTEAMRERMAAHAPLNFIAHPDDMARAALFLLSEESRWTTGCVFPCEGGASI
ncbi:MAG TPA: SDR family oxidoreductase [Streptosporangiaceae bacterium]|jgi:NAD(P)-dependent dehydrogenase (short-subunit alcohol dehydrogenase family)